MDGWIDQTDRKADRQVAREKDKMTETGRQTARYIYRQKRHEHIESE